MYPKKIFKTGVENMPELKAILNHFNSDGWRWYAWVSFAIFKSLCICSQTKFAIDVRDDFALVCYAAATYFIPLLGLAKLYSWLTHYNKIHRMFAIIKRRFWDVNIVGKTLSKRLNARLSIISKTVSMHVYVSVGICTAITIFPLVQYPDGRRKQPSALWFPFNADPSPLYEIIYTILAISNHISVLVNLHYDSLYVYFTQNVSVQFIILRELLKNITNVEGIFGQYRYGSWKYQKIIEDRLKVCMDHHNLLMRCLNDIQEIYSLSLGFQVLLSILSLVFTVHILSMDHSDISKILKVIAFASALTIQILLYNFNATEIQEQYEAVSLAVSQCDWYYGNKDFRQGIMFMTLRSQKPFAINALGLTEINNTCTVMIYRTVFSILTLIKKLTQ